MQKFIRFSNKLMIAAASLSAIILAAAFGLMITEIGLRNVFNTGLVFSVEYSMYMLMFLTFLALAFVQHSGGMIHMGLVYDQLPPRVMVYFDAIRHTIGLAYALIVTWYVSDYVAGTCQFWQRSGFPTRTPLCPPQSVMVIGMLLLCLAFLIGTVKRWHIAITGGDPIILNADQDLGV